MLLGNDSLQAQEVLDSIQFGSWVGNQSLAADDQKLFQWEELQPSLEKLCVNAYFYRSITRVDELVAPINERQFFKLLHVLVFAKRLSVIADGSCYWVPHDQKQSKIGAELIQLSLRSNSTFTLSSDSFYAPLPELMT